MHLHVYTYMYTDQEIYSILLLYQLSLADCTSDNNINQNY